MAQEMYNLRFKYVINSLNIDLKAKVQHQKLLKNDGIPHMQEEMWVCDGHFQCRRYSVRHKGATLKCKTRGMCQCQGVRMLWVAGSYGPFRSAISVPHRRAVSLRRLLQVVIVGQNLHEEVELQSLRLQDKNPPPSGYTRICTQASKTLWLAGNRQASAETDLWLFALHAPDAVWTVHDRVLRHDLARVDLAARAHDAPTGQDHVSPKIGWQKDVFS